VQGGVLRPCRISEGDILEGDFAPAGHGQHSGIDRRDNLWPHGKNFGDPASGPPAAAISPRLGSIRSRPRR